MHGPKLKAKKMDEQLNALLDTAWEKIKSKGRNKDRSFSNDTSPDFFRDEIYWRRSLTDPLPAVWPPSENLSLYYYAYATGLDLAGNLQDGVYVARPWARVEFMPKDDLSPKLILLSDTLVEIGIDGFRPLTAAEESLYQMWPRERVVNFLTQLHTDWSVNETNIQEFKDFFCMRMSHDSIYEELRSKHEAFYLWLRCKHDDIHDTPEPPLEID